MKDTSTGTTEDVATAPGAEPPPPAAEYEPPAVSWEESFEQMVATTCGFYPLDGGPCGSMGVS